ncbi:MAG TPA: aminopeptidase P family protein [Deltaproteobacteria bacterium]|nr:MAG: hypothetical protein A2048_08090 [Deltaproteobacteria bacterium GWA2_45_12]HBF13757.1 aminopeptidase P family protein [Deltaproteobacteria bacterium]
MPQSASLIIASSESDSNLYYATKFLVPDPVIYFEIAGKKHIVLSDLEFDRGKEQACVHQVLSLTKASKQIKRTPKTKDLPVYALVVDHFFKEKKIKGILVPSDFPSNYYVALQKLGYKISVKPDPFYEKRLIKTPEEKKHIIHSIRQVEKAFGEALVFLQKSKIKNNKIYHGKELVTSELLQSLINTRLMELGCVGNHTIVASGVQGSLPHHHGAGPIIPHTPIIFDIFPRNIDSRYFADMTRTVVKGKPSDTIKRMYKAVKSANEKAMHLVKAGANTATIHKAAVTTLAKFGFKTGPNKSGRMEGFIHSTGHGLGLDIHELPSVSSRESILKKGFVITIEPGLYYEKEGGIRLEDDVFVTQNGFEQLTKFPKFLEIDR